MFAKVVLTIHDKDGDTFPCFIRFSVDSSATLLSVAEDYAHVFFDMVNNFLTGAAKECRVEFEPDTGDWPGFGGNPGTLSDVEEKVHVMVRSAIPGTSLYRFTIPTIFEGYFTNDGAGKVLDITMSDVLALYALLTEDISSGGLDAVDFHGTDLIQVVSSHQFFGKG